MSVNLKKPDCFLRLPEVMRRVGFARSSIYAKVSRDEFPAPVSIGGRAIAWLESDVDAWIAHCVSASRIDRVPDSPVSPKPERIAGRENTCLLPQYRRRPGTRP